MNDAFDTHAISASSAPLRQDFFASDSKQYLMNAFFTLLGILPGSYSYAANIHTLPGS